MPLSWNEIRNNAIAFAKEWADEKSEDAEAKTFWDEFFRIFGVSRRRVAVYEKLVEKANNKDGYIDLFWPKVMIAEHKSRGKNLNRAFTQAIDYVPGLPESEHPRYVVVSDFERIRITDLEAEDAEKADFEFHLNDLPKHVSKFGFIAGYQVHKVKEEDPVNIKAAEKLAGLHDALREVGYEGHALEVYLVRLLFCLFADDTGIFMPKGSFEAFLNDRTSPDGSDLASRLAELFQVLNQPPESRLKNLDEQLAEFPYVNGKLFAETLPVAAFDRAMRDKLLACTEMDWGGISPAIFGSLFQGIMDKAVRRNLGAHYTTEKNILKAIGPLFMEDLKAEFGKIKSQSTKLKMFHDKLAGLRIMDPACGCGNFLVISYREIRLLELEVLKKLYSKEIQQLSLDAVGKYVKVDVDQFHGIEIDEWASQIARVAMWLIDHQMNVLVGQEFGRPLVRVPLVKSANIVLGNALRLNWNSVLPAKECSFVVGNPPFVGAKFRSAQQDEDIEIVFREFRGVGQLDYVCAWYRKAVEYIQGTEVNVAFVSTNSITQGEQVGAMWPDLLARGAKVFFAHRTFQWSSEAKGKAAVHCVIIGFGLNPPGQRQLFHYDDPRGEPHMVVAQNINPYLVDAPNIIVEGRGVPLCKVPEMVNGSIPADGGNLILEPVEREELLAKEPGAARWLRKYVGAEGFLHDDDRVCLWLKEAEPKDLKQHPLVMQRVAAVKAMRLLSPKAATRQKASTPTLFTEDRQPANGTYLALPRTSSETRAYIPIGYLPATVIAANDLQMVPNADLYSFGVLTSAMHMAWVRITAGRMKSDFRYSARYTYNTFPWCEPTDTQRMAIEEAAQGILAARAAHPRATLADLYDPLIMPAGLLKAHQKLDYAVDAAYGKRDFKTETDRVAFLFDRYQKLIGLLPLESTPTKRAKKPKRHG